MRQQILEASLTADATYHLDDPILVGVEITNTGQRTVQALISGTPFEAELTADCFTVQRDGEVIPYDGKLVKRGDPVSESYVTIDPGQKLTNAVDISTVYSIDQPGDYTVTLKTTLFDAFTVSGNAKQPPRKRQDHQPHKLPSPTVQFKVVAGGEPKLTVGEKARKTSQQQPKSSARAPNFNGGTSTEQADTLIAHRNAQYFAALAASQLTSGPASTNALYQTWFGAFDQGRYDNVNKHYGDISNTLLSEQVTYDLTGTGCQPGWFAYTHKGDRTVWLCSSYLSAPQVGTDCKFGTLVHEWSHAVSSTDDNAYGESACQTLATNDPGKATNNADSHEYFAEHLAQSDFGKTVTFITDRSTFGKDEIDAMLAKSSPANIEKAFYVLIEGFWPDKLGITAASLGNNPNVKPVIAINPAVSGMTVSVTSLAAEDANLPIEPQRFTWVCQVSFSNSNGFPANPGQVQTVTLTATLAGRSGSAQIQLIREPNPYELDGPTSWLSTDVRVFQIRTGEIRFNATMGSTPGDASTFIKQVIANLNSGNVGGQTFDNISTDPQTSALELSQKVNNTNVYNFAVAKVRYRGTIDISNVRVFFRLFPAPTTSTTFDLNTTYRRTTQGTSVIPLVGLNSNGDLLTIPCFAEPRVDTATASMTTQTDATNVRMIVHDAGGNEVAAYFGCWLDINQTQPQIPNKPSPSDGPWSSGRKTIQGLIRNIHQCLVAEIAFDPDPIPNGVAPAISDKLGQRNLITVESANPGYQASRRILTTFDLRPIAESQQPAATPDELLIEWGNTPRDSVATIYIPEIGASHIIALAGERYVSHKLTQVDGQTIQLPVGGISYVPLPPGVAFGLTGLLSVELPDTVRKGELYTIVVRQVTDAVARDIPVSEDVGIRETRRTTIRAAVSETHGGVRLMRWRRIVGSYQVTIPVRTKEVMLPFETRLLSVLRWILKSVPLNDRWYPVFSRYVGLIGDRVGALGGDPDLVEPSPDGSGVDRGQEPTPAEGQVQVHDGKVTGLIYDCFGDFEGFLLDDCGTEIFFQAREHQIEALARTAWRDRIVITVITSIAQPSRPVQIIFRRAPQPFQG